MKIAANLAGVLLGGLFILFSSMFFLGKMPAPSPDTPKDVLTFMSVFAPGGWLAFVKTCELIGGLLVAIPKTRNFGMLLLGPVIVNIFAFHICVAKSGYFEPVLIVILLLALFLLWAGRKAFARLLN